MSDESPVEETSVEVSDDTANEDLDVEEAPAKEDLDDDVILGATPAEEGPEPEPEVDPDDKVALARARIDELLDQGYKLSQLRVVTNSRGAPVAVDVG